MGCLLSLAWLAYRPGLAGSFLFDDFANLPALGSFGPVDNASTFERYITSGFADPTGRPVALLSFLIDANDWPADPAPFLYTNVFLHLLNGALLCWALLLLGGYLGKTEKAAALAALAGSAIWLLHPLWISTTLYVVQREAMLPATFTLLCLLGYLHGRSRLATHPTRGVVWIACSLVSCTALGFFSKASGLLLPLLILVIEYAFLRSLPQTDRPPAALKTCLAIFAYPPAVFVVAYLAYRGVMGVTYGVPTFRAWTLGERLLTEPRVIVDYVTLLFLPRPYSRGLFNDNYAASTSLVYPWTTLPALLLIVIATVLAIRNRKRCPALAAAFLFYCTAHLVESTTLPLELYFEHRNYVPALLLFWPLGLWLTDGTGWRRIKPILAAGLATLLASETYFAAQLWGNPSIQARVWAAQNPDSPRAQVYAASVERSVGLVDSAEKRLRAAIAKHPDEIQLAINLVGVRCQLGRIEERDLRTAEFALRTGFNRGPLTFDWISGAINLVREHSCEGLDARSLHELIDAARQNAQAREYPRFQQDLLDLEGQLALVEGDKALAEAKFAAAIRVAPQPDVALKQAAILGTYGLPAAGITQLDLYRELRPTDEPPAIRSMQDFHDWLLYRDHYWRDEIARLRQLLVQDAETISTSAIAR